MTKVVEDLIIHTELTAQNNPQDTDRIESNRNLDPF